MMCKQVEHEKKLKLNLTYKFDAQPQHRMFKPQSRANNSMPKSQAQQTPLTKLHTKHGPKILHLTTLPPNLLQRTAPKHNTLTTLPNHPNPIKVGEYLDGSKGQS